MITILIVITLLTQPLTATWERPNIARVTWDGPGCLFHNGRMYHCYQGSGTILIGARGPIDHTDRPDVGSVYTFQHADGTVEQTQIKSVVYFPVFR